MSKFSTRISTSLRWLGAIVGATLLVGCERPPIETVQGGYRGTSMGQVYNQRVINKDVAKNTAPASLPAASADGPKAKEVYQNVKVLGDLSVGEFTRHMASITSWVAPDQGCAYCHNLNNLAYDS